ncbi:MAG TPA: choice-of-anchor D domain-containing protein, partial [bacterium]|nr:choice-of-anchor D domain-containing protein [bacterium]
PDSPTKALLIGRGITGPDVDISPTIFDFGSTPVGSTSEQRDFVIKNTGDGNLNISSITVNSDFEQENECPAILVEEQSCEVGATFVPQVAGGFSGILSVVDDAEGSPHKATLQGFGTTSDVTLLPASLNFGSQTVGRPSLNREVRLLNSGNETIDISDISSSSSEFAQTNDCGATLAPSNFCTIGVVFTPTAAQFYSGRIEIADSAAGSPHFVSLTGTGLDPVYPDLDLSPGYWDFGQVLVGQTSVENAFTLKNTGVVDVVIYSIDANSEFAQANDCPATLASEATCTIRGTFTPEAAGLFTGYITVTDNTFDGYQSATVQGTGTHSGDIDISFSVSALNFGSVTPGEESEVQSIVLTSGGTDPVTIGAVEVAGSETTDFSMNTNCSERSLDVGKSCIINVVFKPTSAGVKTAEIAVFDDAHDSPQAVALQGTGSSGSSSGCSFVAGAVSPAAPFAILALLAAPMTACRFMRRRFRRRG